MVICLERGADLHTAQLTCFSKIQIGFTFLVPAHPGSPGQRAVKWVCMFFLKNVNSEKVKSLVFKVYVILFLYFHIFCLRKL